MFVLGIDPGLTRCGYCVLSADRHRSVAVAMGVFRTGPQDSVPVRLAELWRDVSQLLDEFDVTAVAIERVLFQTNVRTAMSVAQASGVVMAESARRGLDVVEYSPNQVKDAVAGYGSADKAQVQQMVQVLLNLDEPPRPPDAADAAAIALTYLAFNAGTAALLGGGSSR
ncbi:MAG TPA: crossover junction endodeoxyribonuclease RuvC [Microthrixaceae bacterium]|nr:crossover junction endodeoxyribonuclease RuvC [Microthrixaceae bacterium]